MQQMEIWLVILFLSMIKFHAKQIVCAKQLYEIVPLLFIIMTVT